MRKLLLAAALLVATPVWAHDTDMAIVHSCEDILDSIGNLVEPVRSFANGAIRVAHISTEEPTAASEHLLIFVRAQERMGDDCFAVSAKHEDSFWGFYSLDFAKVRASYDEQKGLLLRIPASVNESGSEKPVGDIKVRISRKNDNSVTIEN